MPERLFTTYQVADLLGATPGAVVEWIEKGWLPVQRLPDGPLRVSERGLVQFLKGRGVDLETILAKVAVREEKSRPAAGAAAVELPRLDPAAADTDAAPAAPAEEAEDLERMFPLEAEEREALLAGSAEEPQPLPAGEYVSAAREAKVPAPVSPAKPPVRLRPAMPKERQPAAEDVEQVMEQLAAEAAAGSTADEPAVRIEHDEPATPIATPEPAEATVELPPVAAAPPEASPAEAVVEPVEIQSASARAAAPGELGDEARELIRAAVERGAREIHVEPAEAGLLVRLRIDGVLHPAAACGVEMPPRSAALAVEQLAALAGQTTVGPASGAAEIDIEGRAVDVTVSTCPTTRGLRVVAVLQDSRAMPPDLSQLDLGDDGELLLRRALAQPSGLVILAGRPGRDRAAALAAAVAAMHAESRSIVAITAGEAASVAGLTTISAQAMADASCARAVRTAVAHAADAIVLDDIRDAETGLAILAAAEAGRAVLACVNAPGAVQAIETLLEIGLEPWPLAGAIKAVVAHVRVRRLCGHCRRPGAASEEMLAGIGLAGQKVGDVFEPVGCERCWQTGYLGTAGCTSIWPADVGLASLVRMSAGAAALREAARHYHVRSLTQIGLEMVSEGTTSLQELARVLPV